MGRATSTTIRGVLSTSVAWLCLPLLLLIFYSNMENSSTIRINSMKEYWSVQEECRMDRDKFWLTQAKVYLEWNKVPSVGFKGDFAGGVSSWFEDGYLNVAHNCIDRHAAERVAIIWEGDEPGQSMKITYGQLKTEVSKVANWLLTEGGVTLGDTVTIYMPMTPEIVYVMLACARIGVIHNVVFAGFSAESLADRIIDSNSKIIFTANEGIRGGRIIPLKRTVNDALQREGTECVKKVIVYDRTPNKLVTMVEGRDIWWKDVINGQSTDCVAVPFPAETPLFTLYTSGSTGKPKGLVHTSAGYLLYAAFTFQNSFDYQDGDVYGCLADVGWITGHSYIVYGPLARGATTVLFESTPFYPNSSRYWNLVSRLRINQLYTAPTVIRALKRISDELSLGEGQDLSSLRVLGTVGEPINPDAWIWYHEQVGRGKCSVIDTYWQTETGGHVISPLPNITPTIPGSATFPCIGIDPDILDPHTGLPAIPNSDGSVDGVLVIKSPWPGIARTIHGNHDKFYSTYFAPYKGYYLTGDRAHRDKEGYIWIRGRVDDVINVSGHRLSTAEIEAALGHHPLCAEAAVLGRPDEITGQSIWAFCIMKPEANGRDEKELEIELIKEVRTHIGPFSAPKRAIIVSDLPKTRSGKIMRRLIRKVLEGASTLPQLGDISTLNNPAIIDEIITKVHHT